MELAGRTALLTGATGGLGRAIAKALAARGASVALSARNAEALAALAAELPGEGHRALVADLAEPGAAERLAAEAGEVDVLVANAGLPGAGWLADFTPEQVKRALRVNLEAPMLMAQALFPAMIERGCGSAGLRLLALGQGRQPPAAPSTTRPSSACAASRSGCGPTWRRAASASRSSRRASSAKRGCSPSRAQSRPRGWGPRRPSRSATAVVRAIEQDRVELAVAPLPQRALAHLALATPSISVRVQSGSAGQKAAKAVADGHPEHKR